MKTEIFLFLQAVFVVLLLAFLIGIIIILSPALFLLALVFDLTSAVSTLLTGIKVQHQKARSEARRQARDHELQAGMLTEAAELSGGEITEHQAQGALEEVSARGSAP